MRIGLIGLMGLMGVVLVQATPQVSDADLKAAQVPVISVGDAPNFQQLRISATGGTRVIYNGCNASSIDFSGFGGGSYLDFSNNAGTAFSLGGLFSFLSGTVWINYLSFNNCGFEDAQLAGFVAALGNSTAAQGFVWQVGLFLQDNHFTTLDVSGTSIALNSSNLDFSNNAALTTVAAGDGVTFGFTSILMSTLNLSGCALTNASEDSVLDADVALETAVPGQAGVLDISGGTNAVPDTAGADDIATLVATGWTITTN